MRVGSEAVGSRKEARTYLIEKIYAKESWIFVNPPDLLMFDMGNRYYSKAKSENFRQISGHFAGFSMAVFVLSKKCMNANQLAQMLQNSESAWAPDQRDLEKQDMIAPCASIEESRKAFDYLSDFLENEAA